MVQHRNIDKALGRAKRWGTLWLADLDEFGWEVADMGSAEAARAIEPLCMLWCIPGFLRNDWVHAFKLLA